MAIASTAIEMRSPAVSSMSSSRGCGCGVTCWARSIRSSVLSPMAETTTTTSWPFFLVSTMRRATRLMHSASATDEPPYFWTISATSARTSCRIRRGLGQVTSLPAAPAPPRDVRIVGHPSHSPYGRRCGTHPGQRRGRRRTPRRTAGAASAPRSSGRRPPSPAGSRAVDHQHRLPEQQCLAEDHGRSPRGTSGCARSGRRPPTTRCRVGATGAGVPEPLDHEADEGLDQHDRPGEAQHEAERPATATGLPPRSGPPSPVSHRGSAAPSPRERPRGRSRCRARRAAATADRRALGPSTSGQSRSSASASAAMASSSSASRRWWPMIDSRARWACRACWPQLDR